jgi:septum formation protein
VPLVLASASPRRRALLEALSLRFTVVAAAGDGPVSSTDPGKRVLGHAWFKAHEVAKDHPSAWILAADTLVFGAGEFFPKPQNREHAGEMLERLIALGVHQVWTGTWLLSPQGDEFQHLESAEVSFAPIPCAERESYLDGVEWADKAGAYAIQGWAGQYTTLLEGEFDTVVGLSKTAIFALFEQAGLSPAAFRR